MNKKKYLPNLSEVILILVINVGIQKILILVQ